MNREIKFRGQRIDTKEWVYGFYNYTFERGYISQSYDDVPYRCHYIDNDNSYYEIEGHTVGQYIGLNDKYEKEIYENDIIKRKGEIAYVVYDDSEFCLYYRRDKFPVQHGLLCKGWIEFLDVIGNIHDNPELIKEEEE